MTNSEAADEGKSMPVKDDDPWKILESWRCVTPGDFVRVLTHLLESTDYNIEAHCDSDELDLLRADLDALRGMEKLKVKVRE